MEVAGLYGLGFSQCDTKSLVGLALWVSSVAEEDVEGWSCFFVCFSLLLLFRSLLCFNLIHINSL